ncbi:DivIVA domain-containing protein [Herbiconiux solani]|uniref:DivIVA domain-containing protein n=1 Tax=Herbiconiux solani TaxID=661329 RepID=UPI0008252840|nr:DivIVA domain-containing protein [Herbiconiux solani]
MGLFGFGGPRKQTPLITAEAVAAARLTPTAFRQGYDTDEVDAFLARCAASIAHLEGGPAPAYPVSTEDVVQARFTQTKFRTGYDQDEVDDLLDRVAVTLRGTAPES